MITWQSFSCREFYFLIIITVEVCKIHTWLAMAEASEAESASGPPTMLEIPMAFVVGREI